MTSEIKIDHFQLFPWDVSIVTMFQEFPIFYFGQMTREKEVHVCFVSFSPLPLQNYFKGKLAPATPGFGNRRWNNHESWKYLLRREWYLKHWAVFNPDYHLAILPRNGKQVVTKHCNFLHVGFQVAVPLKISLDQVLFLETYFSNSSLIDVLLLLAGFL